MRNATELIAAATTTGTFTNYRGDGASVPWQVAIGISLPAGFTMWAYKQYLDFRFPDAFKLHDWCYTPYGRLIAVTREEADSAMRELIAVTSPVDAEIVYAAVRAAGDPYFGVSQTGYTGPQAQGASANIGFIPADNAPAVTPGLIPFDTLQEVFMVATKAVLKFNGNTTAANAQPSIGYVGDSHAFGFTESIWRNGMTVQQTVTYLRTHLGPARANLLPANVKLTGATLYGQNGGRGVDVPLGFAGSFGTTDQVNVGVLLETRHDTAIAQRRWWIHCIPDELVRLGEFAPTLFDSATFRNYLDKMSLGDWLGIDQNDLSTIMTVDETGLVTLAGNSPFAVGQWLRVNRTFTEAKQKRGGRFMVESVGPLLTQFKFASWTLGKTTGGLVYRPTYSFYNIGGGDGPYIVRAGTRRVGRPFALYRGRQPARL